VTTAVALERSRIESAYAKVDEHDGSRALGEHLAARFAASELVHVFVLSDGLKVNGSELVRGMQRVLPAHVQVTGGLSGDGGRFKQTLVFAGREPREGVVCAVGFYGPSLKIGYGSLGGWIRSVRSGGSRAPKGTFSSSSMESLHLHSTRATSATTPRTCQGRACSSRSAFAPRTRSSSWFARSSPSTKRNRA